MSRFVQIFSIISESILGDASKTVPEYTVHCSVDWYLLL